MKENDVRNMDLTSRKAGEGSGEDERLLMMLGEALGDMPGDEETQNAWRRFEARHGDAGGSRLRLRRIFISAAVAAAVVALVVAFAWSDIVGSAGVIETFPWPNCRRIHRVWLTETMLLCRRRRPLRLMSFCPTVPA